MLPATAHFGNNLHNHVNTQGRKAQLFYDDGTMMVHDETARNLIADVNGGNISPIAGGRAAGPLQKPKHHFYEEVQDTQMTNQVAQEDDLALMWPS